MKAKFRIKAGDVVELKIVRKANKDEWNTDEDEVIDTFFVGDDGSDEDEEPRDYVITIK